MEPRPPPAPRGGGGDPSHPLPPPPRAHVPHAPLPGAPRGRPVAFRQRAVPRGPLPPPEPELADADADADDAPEGGGEGGGQAAEAVAAAHLRGVHALLWRQRLAPLVPPGAGRAARRRAAPRRAPRGRAEGVACARTDGRVRCCGIRAAALRAQPAKALPPRDERLLAPQRPSLAAHPSDPGPLARRGIRSGERAC